MAQWLDEHLPAGTPVAVFDIGAIGFFSHVEILDLGGLTNPDFLPYLYGHRVPQYLKERNIDFMVLPMQQVGSLDGVLGLEDSPRLTKRKIVEFSSPTDVWMPGFAATGHAWQRQVLYRITQ